MTREPLPEGRDPDPGELGAARLPEPSAFRREAQSRRSKKIRIIAGQSKPSGRPSASSDSSGSRRGAEPSHAGADQELCNADVQAQGRQLLEDIRNFLGRFIVVGRDTDLDLLALWVLHTHLAKESFTTPRLIIDSVSPGSGKTTVLEHLELLCLNAIRAASFDSPALLPRMLNEGDLTFLIDEADRVLAPNKYGLADLLGIINSGYKVGSTKPTLVPDGSGGWKSAKFPTFCPVAMAGNNPILPDDTQSRCIRILLMPDALGEAEESDWELITPESLQLHARIVDWADLVRDAVRSNRPNLPKEVQGRARERWAPLKRVAEAAGGRWPSTVDELALRDIARINAEREEGLVYDRHPVVLLQDIHHVWPEDQSFISTEDLLNKLIRHNPQMWSESSSYQKDLNPQRLGRMLVKAFDIHSDRSSLGKRERGYRWETFERAFQSFKLSPPPPGRGTGNTGPTGRIWVTG